MTYAYTFNQDLSDPQASTMTIVERLREPVIYDRESLELAIANTRRFPFVTENARLYQLAKYQGALAFLLRNLENVSWRHNRC